MEYTYFFTITVRIGTEQITFWRAVNNVESVFSNSIQHSII